MNKMLVIGVLVLIIAAIGVYFMTQQPAAGTSPEEQEINSVEESLDAFESEALTEPDFSELVAEEDFS